MPRVLLVSRAPEPSEPETHPVLRVGGNRGWGVLYTRPDEDDFERLLTDF